MQIVESKDVFTLAKFFEKTLAIMVEALLPLVTFGDIAST
jgi:hypothetical protein